MENISNSLLGGVLIGLGSLMALAASGKIPGVSGIIARVIRPKRGDVLWRVLFLVGIVAGCFVVVAAMPGLNSFAMPGGRGTIAICWAGLLVGFGTRLGGGCTSGHGVCGIGAGAKDALIYTLIFMASGAATVWVWNVLNGGAR